MQRERQRHRLLWGLLCTGGASDILTAYDYYVRMLLARESLYERDRAYLGYRAHMKPNGHQMIFMIFAFT
jgi:hypothetical protein